MNSRLTIETKEEFKELRQELRLPTGQLIQRLIDEHYELTRIKNKVPINNVTQTHR